MAPKYIMLAPVSVLVLLMLFFPVEAGKLMAYSVMGFAAYKVAKRLRRK